MKFEIVPPDSGLAPEVITSLELAFTGFFAKARKWRAEAESITDPKAARAARLQLKALRVEADKKHKELKEDSLRFGKAIDGAKNILLALIVPIEKQLDEIEKQEERAEAARLLALSESRAAELAAINHDSHGLNLSILTEDQWTAYLQNTKDAAEARIAREAREREEAEAKAAKEREEAVKRAEAEAAERERLRAEQERLHREAEEAKAKAEALLAEQAKAAAKAKAKADKEREEANAKLMAAAKEKAKLEAEAKALRDAEAKRIADEQAAAAAKAKAEAAAARKAARAPDKGKLLALAGIIRTLEVPPMKTAEGETLAGQIEVLARQFAQWITEEAEKL